MIEPNVGWPRGGYYKNFEWHSEKEVRVYHWLKLPTIETLDSCDDCKKPIDEERKNDCCSYCGYGTEEQRTNPIIEYSGLAKVHGPKGKKTLEFFDKHKEDDLFVKREKTLRYLLKLGDQLKDINEKGDDPTAWIDRVRKSAEKT